MPLFRQNSGGGFRPPSRSDNTKNASQHAPGAMATQTDNVPRFLHAVRRPAAPSSRGTYKAPASSGRAEDAAADAPIEATEGSSTCDASTHNNNQVGGQRVVLYPSCRGTTQEDIIAQRLAKRAHLNYHQPAPPASSSRSSATKEDASVADGMDEEGPDGTTTTTTTLPPSANSLADATAVLTAAADAAEEAEEDDAPATVVVPRYPVSPHNKLYFQVETDGATRHECVGIIIIDVEQHGVMMFDRVGRQFGNRPDPGYPIRPAEVEAACAGQTMKVGNKAVLLITALAEESFRSGEFFLRSEHDMRIKEDRNKAKQEAAAAAADKLKKPTMSFGTNIGGRGVFAAQLFRKRPRDGETGFVVPLAGRPKQLSNGLLEDLHPLHDPDREGAVVLFRADYKRDAHGRRQVSVVVDPIIGDKLRPHQRVGVRFLFDCITGERMAGYHGAILADEMGLGKTIQTVATIYTCLKQGKHGVPTARKCLVVTPSSLVKNWGNEFDKWLGVGAVKHFAISESTPKGDRIISRFDGEGDVLVISYDQLRKYVSRLSTLSSIQLVVCDEGHRLKNAEVKTTKAVDQLPTRNRVILSGTPIQNDLSEFHAMVGFVNPGILGNRDLFSRVFEEPVSLGRDPSCPDHLKLLGRDRAHYLSVLTQRFILRRTQTINESYLPPKVDLTVFVRLGEQQMSAYRALSDVVERAACTPLVLISALRKLCNHMDLFHEAVQLSNQRSGGRGDGDVGGGIPRSVVPKGFKRGSLDAASGSKLSFVSMVLDEIRRNGEHDKLVIVSNFTQTLDIIAALCAAKKVAFFQLDGSTPIKKRQELVDYFNVPGSQEIVFLLSSKAGGVGLNLIGANRLILFDPDWNPANDAQAMGRVWRDGQKKRVFIYRLLSTGTIEEKIYQRQVSKQGLSANVVDMQEDSKQHFTLEELKSLFQFKGGTNSDTHDLLQCSTCEAVLARGGGKKTETSPSKMKFRAVGVDGGKKSGPRMDELKAWRHVEEVAKLELDKVVQLVARQAPELISFVFADERDNTAKKTAPTVGGLLSPSKSAAAGQKAVPRVEVERPFEADEDAIVCASQAAEAEEEAHLEIEVVSESTESEEESDEEEDSAGSSSDDD